jgi:hypothetical protein
VTPLWDSAANQASLGAVPRLDRRHSYRQRRIKSRIIKSTRVCALINGTQSVIMTTDMLSLGISLVENNC